MPFRSVEQPSQLFRPGFESLSIEILRDDVFGILRHASLDPLLFPKSNAAARENDAV